MSEQHRRCRRRYGEEIKPRFASGVDPKPLEMQPAVTTMKRAEQLSGSKRTPTEGGATAAATAVKQDQKGQKTSAQDHARNEEPEVPQEPEFEKEPNARNGSIGDAAWVKEVFHAQSVVGKPDTIQWVKEVIRAPKVSRHPWNVEAPDLVDQVKRNVMGMFSNTLVDLAVLTKQKRKYQDLETAQERASARLSAIAEESTSVVERMLAAKKRMKDLQGHVKSMEASLEENEREKQALKDRVDLFEQEKEAYVVGVVTECVVKYQSLLDRLD